MNGIAIPRGELPESSDPGGKQEASSKEKQDTKTTI